MGFGLKDILGDAQSMNNAADMITQGNAIRNDREDRKKSAADEAAVQKYLGAMTNGQEVDLNSKDFNALAHQKAVMAVETMRQTQESTKQQRMQTMGQRIETNHAQLVEAMKMADAAKAGGDPKRGMMIQMAAYNDLAPDGYKLGMEGDKMVMRDPKGNITDAEVTPEEMDAMAKQMMGKEAYAQTYMGMYSQNKAHNQQILNNPERVKNKDGEELLIMRGLIVKETGELKGNLYQYRGKTIDENMARQMGFKTDAGEEETDMKRRKDKAQTEGAESDAATKGFGVKNQEADRAMDIKKDEAQIKYWEQGGDARARANGEVTVGGKTYTKEQYAVLKRVTDKLGPGIMEKGWTDEHTVRFMEMAQDPRFKEVVESARRNPQHKKALEAKLKEMGLEALVPEIDRIDQLI